MAVIRALVLFFALTAAFSAHASCGSRGFGTTSGVGNTDMITTAYATTPTGQSSYAIRYYANSTGGGGLGVLFRQGTSTSVSFDQLGYTSAPNMAFAYGGIVTYFYTFTAPSTGVWHDIVVAFDAATPDTVPVIWVDGVSQTVTKTQGSGGILTSSEAFTLGNRASDLIRVFDGRQADFAIWSGVKLTANEAASYHAGKSPLQIRPTALVLYLPLCGAPGNEPDYGPSRLAQTTSGTVGRGGPPSNAFPFQTVPQ